MYKTLEFKIKYCDNDLRKEIKILKLYLSFSIVWLVLFIIKLVPQIDVFEYVTKKHMPDIIKIVKKFKTS